MPPAADRKRVMLTLAPEDYALIEAAAGDIPVATWCRAAVLATARDRIKAEGRAAATRETADK